MNTKDQTLRESVKQLVINLCKENHESFKLGDLNFDQTLAELNKTLHTIERMENAVAASHYWLIDYIKTYKIKKTKDNPSDSYVQLAVVINELEHAVPVLKNLPNPARINNYEELQGQDNETQGYSQPGQEKPGSQES